MANFDRWLKNVSQADVARIAKEKREKNLVIVENRDELPPVETTPGVEFTPVDSTGPVEITPVTSTPVETTPGVKNTSALLEKTPVVETTPAVDSTPVPAKKGHLRVPNEIMDNVLPTMRPPEQAVFLRLYRLSHGYGKKSCLISLPKLALSCRLSESQTRFAVRNVEARGYIKQVRIEQGATIRGIEFEVWTPVESTPVRITPVDSTGVDSTPNKGNIKEISKNAVDCPDCKGSGWYYPQGVAKGVRRCKHEKLKL